MSIGKVWLVGAGPGETDLLTIKGKKVIEEAQVVVYDKLVGQGILMLIPEDAEAINVGKRAGNHTMPQGEINKVLLEQALQGKRVVRLKGGDPFLFGRGGEELELLKKYNIPFEIIPGITSAISVPAYNGIPVTHRDYCSSVHIITGHSRESKNNTINFKALTQVQGTLIFLMGVSALGEICNGLLEAGMDRDMPAAILQKGTTSRQKRILGTISTLAGDVKKEGIETPAIIVVGKTCQLAEDFSWYEKLPLAGQKILITRPEGQQWSISEILKNKGAEVLEFPTIKIEPCKEREELKKALSKLNEIKWLVFTSPSGVDIFFNIMREEKIDIRNLINVKVAVTGKATKKRVEDMGIIVDLIPSIYNGVELGKLIRMNSSDKDRVLIPRASHGNEEILLELKKNASLNIMDIPIYDTKYSIHGTVNIEGEIKEGNIDFAVFTSTSTVKGLVCSIKNLDGKLVKAVCIGEQTKAEAERNNMMAFMSKEATIKSLVEKIEELVEENKED